LNCVPAYAPVITSTTTFGICDNPVTLTANASDPSGNTVDYVEFFVDDVSIGQDNSSPYSADLNNPLAGSHDVKAVAYYSPVALPSTSYVKSIYIADGIYQKVSTPIIDGVIESGWNNYKSYSLNLVSQGTVSSSADLSAYFKVKRDATNLYILVDVTDDILRNDGAANWQKDGVELYIDMGNDKTGAYQTNNDYQYSFVWNISTPKPGMTFAQTTKAGNLGYILEIQLPWATLSGAQADGTFIGLDIHVEDNDSGTRNGKKAWNDATDNAWQSTSVLGTFQIAGCSIPLSTSAPILFSEEGISFYPNPFLSSGNLKLNTDNMTHYSINIKDISGKVLETQYNHTGEGLHAIGDTLPPGMYLLEVIEDNTVQTIKIIKQ
jgi:hypothetical protein